MFMFGSEGWERISLDEDSIYLSLNLSLKVKGVVLGEEFGPDPLRETVKKVNKVEVNPRGELHHARRTQEIHTRVQSECSAGV